MITFTFISLFTNFFTCFLLAILLIPLCKKYPNLLVFNIVVSSWSLFNGLYMAVDDPELSLLYSQITLFLIVLIPYFFLRTAVNFADFKIKPVYNKLNTIVAITISLSMFTPIMITGVEPFLGFKYIPDTTIFFNLYYLYLSIAVIYGEIIIFKSIKYNYKNKIIFNGFLVGWIGGPTILFQYMGIEIYPFALILVSGYSSIIVYSVISHRILDGTLMFNRITTKALILTLLGIFYIISIKVLDLFIGQDQYYKLAFNIIYFIISLEFYQILFKEFNAIKEKRRIGTIYNKSKITDSIKEIINIVKIDQLATKLTNIIENEIGVKIQSFYIDSNLKIIESNDNNVEFIKYSGLDIKENNIKKIQRSIKNNKFLLSIKKNEVNWNFRHVMDREDFQGLIPFSYNDKIIAFITIKSRLNKKNYFYYEDMELFDDLASKSGIALERIRLHLKFLSEKEMSLKSLAGSIAHELRNPLGSIKLATDNLESLEQALDQNEQLKAQIYQDPKVKEAIEEGGVRTNNYKYQINKTINLAGNIIDMTLHQLGGKKFDKEDFDYNLAQRAVLDAVTLYGYKNNEEKKRIFIKLDDKKVTADQASKQKITINDLDKGSNFIMFANDTGFKYIIFNLIKNALFYLKDYPNSDIVISCDRNQEIDAKLIKKFNIPNPNSSSAKYNIISVTDTGPGIKEEIITKIFQSYFTSGKRGGTGVGLDFCQRMMDDFGGGIICESEFGKWTKFSLLFPILNQNDHDKGVKQLSNFEEQINKALKEGKDIAKIEQDLEQKPIKRILLIDDIRTNIEMLAKDLRSKCSNFDITIMTDPVKAFELIKDNQIKGKNYDLILTDIEMPEMSGTELIAKVREELNIAKDNIPILAYSSRENQKIIDEAKNAGCNAYYTKPKDLRFIARNISKWTSNNYVPRKNTHHEEIIINENTLKDLNVIIADDQVMNLMLITRKFKSHGANVEKASDGEDIIKLMKDDLTKYHLIITDINMERINGIEAATEVRKMEKEYNLKHDKNINIPIIALSGDSHKEFVLKMLNNNIDDYMVKGSDPSDLIKLSKFWVDYRFDTHHNNIKQNIKKEQKAIITNGVLRRDFVQLFSNKAEAKEIIDIFEIESNIIFKLITDNKSDPVELTKEIHKIKGSSGSVGALKLSNYTAILNDIVKTGKLPEDDKFNLKIKEIIDETIKEMHIAIDDNFD